MSATNLLPFDLGGKTVSLETYGVTSYVSGWRKDVVRLLRVCILSLARAATSIIFVATNMYKRVSVATEHVFCPDKNMLVVTKLCRDKNMFVVTKLCRDKNTLVETKLCRDKNMLVVTKLCRDKNDTCGSSR